MTQAICFKCGSAKSNALAACRNCYTIPNNKSELAISIALSEHLSTQDKLLQYSHEIQSRRNPSIPNEALSQAENALKDPQLLHMLRRQAEGNNPTPPTTPQPPVIKSSTRQHTLLPQRRTKARLNTTALHQSPFALLGATTRDDRRRIVDLVEEMSLELDHDICQKTSSDLTNPRTRLSAEIAWLPGVAPRKASQLVESLLHNPMAVRNESGLPTLAHLNLLAAAFEAVDSEHDAGDLTTFIQEIAYRVDEIDPEDVLRDINEDRAVSGFPELRAVDLIEAELSERKRYYRSAIKEALNRMPPTTLVLVMTDTVEAVTLGGEEHAPELIDDLVDSYEVETQGFLQKEAENAHKLIKAAHDSASSGEAAVKPYLDKLDTVARNWDKIAQPIQLCAKPRGIDHKASRDLAYEIRNLALYLCNEHGMLVQAQQLTDLLRELFAELPQVSELVEKDADSLAYILQEQQKAQERDEEWENEITYSAEIGLIFKDTLSISPNGVSWKSQKFPLDSITQVRWGGIRNYVNGVPTGTTYTIAFGDNRSEAVVELKRVDIYTKFIDKLWKAACVRIMFEMIAKLKNGQNLHMGNAIIHDDGITLVKHNFWRADERVRCPWGKVNIWNADGSFCIGSKDDKKTNVTMSYIHVANTHILEQLIRIYFKKPGLRRLSEALQ